MSASTNRNGHPSPDGARTNGARTNGAGGRFPKLRAVDIRPHQENGHAYFLLRDPLSLSENALLVPQGFGPVLALCDGSLPDEAAIAAAAAQRYGLSIARGQVQELLHALDAGLLLANERSDAAIAQVRQNFRQAPHRPPTLAGLSYPAEPVALAAHLDEFIHASGAAQRKGDDPSIRGVFSPHIDFPRGGHVYAHGWKQAEAAAQAAELVIVLGTDHYGNDPFTLTRQSYATPFGTLPTATEIVDELADELADALGHDAAFAGELRHRDEHSIELVALWLHHMRRGQPVAMLPVLVGSLHRYFNGSTPANPTNAPHIAAFLRTLQRHAQDRRTLVIASGDLAHVGSAFGGSPLTAKDRRRVQAADQALIAQLCRGNALGFLAEISAVGDQNNVCGTAPGYLTLALLQNLHGNVSGESLAYDSCPADPQDRSAVTIASVVFR